MLPNQITCLVPTHNRPQFLRRFLTFYTQVEPSFAFLIVDSSDASAAADNLAAIAEVRGKLLVNYEHHDLPFMEKCIEGLQHTHSPFVVMCADDDVLFSETIVRSAQFLEVHPGYASAMGRIAQFDLIAAEGHDQLNMFKLYSIEHAHPFQRCQQMAREFFSNFYAVYRTHTLLRNFQIAAAHSEPQSLPHLSEILLSQLSVLSGRVKVFPQIHSLWERHGDNASIKARASVQPEAQRLFQIFKDCFVDQLAQVGVSNSIAASFVEQWFGHFKYPDLAVRRCRRPAMQRLSRFFRSGYTRLLNHFSQEHHGHCAYVRPQDLVGVEVSWDFAVRLIRQHPQGLAANDTARCMNRHRRSRAFHQTQRFSDSEN